MLTSRSLGEIYKGIKQKIQSLGSAAAQGPQLSLASDLTRNLSQVFGADSEGDYWCKERLVEIWPRQTSGTDFSGLLTLIGLVGITVVQQRILDTPTGRNSPQDSRIALLEQLVNYAHSVSYDQNDPRLFDFIRQDLARICKNYVWLPSEDPGWKAAYVHAAGRRAHQPPTQIPRHVELCFIYVVGTNLTHLQTLTKLVDLCLRLQRSDIVGTLFAGLKIAIPADLTNICHPLFVALKPVLDANGSTFKQPPLLLPARTALKTSTSLFLGPLATTPLNLSISGTILNVGVWDVNSFLTDPARHCMKIAAVAATRNKLESSLTRFVRSGQLLPMETIKGRTPYTLVIRKKIEGIRTMSLSGVPTTQQILTWRNAKQECGQPTCRQCISLTLMIDRADGRAKVNETVKALGESSTASVLVRSDLLL